MQVGGGALFGIGVEGRAGGGGGWEGRGEDRGAGVYHQLPPPQQQLALAVVVAFIARFSCVP
jgi:hypothetical protein